MGRDFSVDLRAVVELFARHVYSSPRVFVRELLQNAVDAQTARRLLDPSYRPGAIRLWPSDAGGEGALVVEDDGVGINESEVHELLATIGGSSKRDEIDLPREGFLGRFGIGLLSCFVVAEEIELTSRSGRGGAPIRFVGRHEGTYEVEVLDEDDPRLPPGPGTRVRLDPRHDARHWVDAATVVRLAQTFGEVLPVPVRVGQPDGPSVDVVDPDPPWFGAVSGPGSGRATAQAAWCERRFGFEPLAVIPLRVLGGGVEGVAFVTPYEVHSADPPAQLVYLNRMLLGDDVRGLVPEWGFFVRCVFDVSGLHPTASRESLADDEALLQAREEIADVLREWLLGLGQSRPHLLAQILQVHGRAAKALAAHDDDAFAVLAQWLPFETSAGVLTLPEVVHRAGTVRWTATVERFRQLASIVTAQGLVIVNGGYTYDRELLARASVAVPGAVSAEIEDIDVRATLDEVDVGRALAARVFVERGTEVLAEVGCDLDVRVFEPELLPALLLQDDAAMRRRQMRSSAEVADDDWAALLGELDDGGPDRPLLVCNDRHVLVQRLVDRGCRDEADVAALQALYVQAMLLGQHPLRGSDIAMLNHALIALVERAVAEED